MRYKVQALIAVSLVVALGLLAPQSKVANSNAQPNPTQSTTVAVCPQQRICFRDPAIDPTIPRFASIEEARKALEPLGGGTVLLARGIYRTTLSFQGNWTLRGTEFAESTILLPKEKGEAIVDEFGRLATPENVALLTVESDSTLRLENLTLQDDFAPITLDESNLPPDEGIGNEAYSQLYARVATGVIVRENARLIANNVRFLNWLSSALSVAGYGEAVVQNSEFLCPSNVLIAPGLFMEGKARFTQSLFDHCRVDSSALSGQLEFSESEFKSAGISGGETLTVTKSLFRDPFIFGPHADFARGPLSQIVPAAKTTLIDNTFEISDKFLKYRDTREFEALPVFGYLTAINNVFRGFSVALNLFNQSHGNVNVQLVKNTFERNQTALFFIGLGPYILEGNRFIDNEECAITFVLAFRTDSLQLQGKDNEFQSNTQDICPSTFLLPKEFVKPKTEPSE